MLKVIKYLIKKLLKEIKRFCLPIYEKYNIKNFIDRKHNYEYMLIILAGYKPTLWDIVLKRIKLYIPENIDVCVVTSGMENDKLKEYCEKYNWSYLSTKRNCLTMAQNIAIDCHPNAKYIYKIDEDMFITEGFFENMKVTYDNAMEHEDYEVGFVAPLIPINGYGHLRIINKLGLVNDWENKFGALRYTHHEHIINGESIAKYLWGESCQELRSIDKLNKEFSENPLCYTICPIRFNIGAVFFDRTTWYEWGRFRVPLRGNGLGLDEEIMCGMTMQTSRIIVVSENSVVGHLAFGPQTKAMMAYYEEHKEWFDIPV